MPWFFVDDAFADSKPVMALDRSLRNEAIGLWVRCGAWSAKEETDGHVPMDTVRNLGGTPRLVKALQFQAELWQKPNENTVATMGETTTKTQQKSREIVFANWAKWQKTKAETEAKRRREAEKKNTWRAGKKGRDYIPPDDGLSTGDSMVDNDLLSTGDTGGVSLYPDPTRPDPTPSVVETLVGEGTLVDANGIPRPHCSKHETNSPTVKCPECKARRLWDEANEDQLKADELQRKRDEKAAAADALKNCRLCDSQGWLIGPDGTPVEPATKCKAHVRVKEASGE